MILENFQTGVGKIEISRGGVIFSGGSRELQLFPNYTYFFEQLKKLKK